MSASGVLSVIAPQFDSRTNRSEYISLATLQVNESIFGSKYDLAIAYMAAHMMSVNTETGAGTGTGTGFITSKKEGDLAVSYAKPESGSGGGDASLSQSSYGQQFIDLRNSCTLILGVTGLNEFTS